MRPLVIRSFFFILAGLFVCAPPAHAQSSNDLVAKNLAARGGYEKLASIGTIQFTGKIVYPGDFELTYEETRARKDGKARIESSIQGLTLVQGYDGNVGWRINPFEGRRDAERMSADDTHAMADNATIDGPLLAAKSRGSTITYLGRENFEGTDAYKLRVVDPAGVQYLYFLDPDTYLEIKVVETRKIRGAPVMTMTVYGDYEQINGVYFPFAIDSGPLDSPPEQRSKLTIDAARVNVPVTDMQFTMPAAPGAK